MADIEFRDVDKIYPDGTKAVHSLDLAIEDGEFVVLVGPSGCGKSTLLRMLAGLEEISGGEVAIGGRVVNDLTPQERNIAMVFQNYALYPHMTVRENLAFPLRMMKRPKAEIAERVEETARMLSLSALLERQPKNLSGGQRQRVAMGRALVREPAAFLMDEPLSNLDAKLRVQMRAEIAQLQRRLGTTTVYVTHDQVEALTLGDRLAVLKAGRLQQVGTPQEIYDTPANVFVATFIGSPSMNLFKSRLVGADGGLGLRFGETVLPVSPESLRHGSGVEHRDEELIFGLRPEAFTLGEEAPPEQRFRARVEALEALGHEVVAYIGVDVAPAPVDEGRDLGAGPAVDEAEARSAASSLLATRLPGTLALERGDELELGVDTSRLYAFDLEGEALAG